VKNVQEILLPAVDIATGARDDQRRSSLLKMIACIINKMHNDAQMVNFVDSVITSQWISKLDYDRRKEDLELLPWVDPFRN
jgi:hypothetical protein